MTTLNRDAAEAIGTLPPGAVHACTDITGFGLVGHAVEMAAASGVGIQLEAARVPLLPGAAELSDANRSGGLDTNREHFAPRTATAAGLDPRIEALLFDPQTSGGLLVALDAAHVSAAIEALERHRTSAFWIGHVVPAGPRAIVVR